MFLNAKDMLKFRLQASDGEIGAIHDLYIDDQRWTVRYIVADTGHWLPGRLVLISPSAARDADNDARRLAVDLTKDMIKNSPAASNERPVSKQHQIDLHAYYGWPAYWGAEMTYAQPIPFTPPVDEGEKKKSKQEDPHLRSAREVIGYRIEARDGEIGHVEDFILECRSWIVRYVVVDTKNWLPGPKAFVPPAFATRIEWEPRQVFLDLTRDQIQNSPKLDPNQPLDREFEERLFAHYGRRPYWNE